MNEEERLWLWLNYATGPNPGLFYMLLEEVDDLEETYEAVRSGDASIFETLDPAVKQRLRMAAEDRFLDRYTGWMEKNGVKFVTPESDDYPILLEKSENPPSVLFYRGTMHAELILPIAFTAYKDASDYGRETARMLGRQIAESGGTVVAGIDGGIGSAALSGALECVLSKAPACGILPCGIDQVPEGQQELCEALAERGCLFTEFLPKTEPQEGATGRINRLSKHFSRAMILIETSPNAKYSGREEATEESGWYAVPGRISDPKSSVPNRMIKERFAKPVLEAADILSDFSDYIETPEPAARAGKRTVSFLRLNDLAQRIYMALRQGDKSAEDLSDWVDAGQEDVEEMLRKMKNAEIVRKKGSDIYTIDQSTTVVTFGD